MDRFAAEFFTGKARSGEIDVALANPAVSSRSRYLGQAGLIWTLP